MKLNIDLITECNGIEYEENHLVITLIKEDYISYHTFVDKIKNMINNFDTIPYKIHYNEGIIKLYYNDCIDIRI